MAMAGSGDTCGTRCNPATLTFSRAPGVTLHTIVFSTGTGRHSPPVTSIGPVERIVTLVPNTSIVSVNGVLLVITMPATVTVAPGPAVPVPLGGTEGGGVGADDGGGVVAGGAVAGGGVVTGAVVGATVGAVVGATVGAVDGVGVIEGIAVGATVGWAVGTAVGAVVGRGVGVGFGGSVG